MKKLKSFVDHVKNACDTKCGSIQCGFLRCPKFFATYDDQYDHQRKDHVALDPEQIKFCLVSLQTERDDAMDKLEP